MPTLVDRPRFSTINVRLPYGGMKNSICLQKGEPIRKPKCLLIFGLVCPRFQHGCKEPTLEFDTFSCPIPWGTHYFYCGSFWSPLKSECCRKCLQAFDNANEVSYRFQKVSGKMTNETIGRAEKVSHDHRRGSRHARIWGTHGFHAAGVDATPDLEQALHAPCACTPTIGNKPIVSARFCAPTNHLHGVAAFGHELPKVFLVDAALVGHEAFVNLEGNLDRAMCHDLLLHVWDASNRITPSGLLPWERLAVDALRRAWWHCATACRIRHASVCDDAGIRQVRPCVGKTATLATHVRLVASHHVLCWKHCRRLPCCNRNTVTQNLGSRESPATATTLLVANGMDQTWPVCPGIKLCWNCGNAGIRSIVQSGIKVLRNVGERCAHEDAGIVEGHVSEILIMASSPRGVLDTVVRINEVVGIDLRLSISDWVVASAECLRCRVDAHAEEFVATRRCSTYSNGRPGKAAWQSTG